MSHNWTSGVAPRAVASRERSNTSATAPSLRTVPSCALSKLRSWPSPPASLLRWPRR
ncbi:Uncharacterised protein [Mycobacteroides abscessus subsp. abscessus]|nr:Uncharacterised protein [Mycobacteroides abscessus subsp. abscessus]